MQLTKHEETHNALLRKAAAECTVLLKKDGAFPLSAPCKVALYGNGARHTVKGGTGSGGVNSRFYVTAEQGLERAGFEITTKDWLDGYDAAKASWHKDFVEGIKKRAQEEGVSLFVAGFGAIEKERDYSLPIAGEGDTAVYVLSRVSGEGNDRTPVCGDVLLTDTEVRDILEAADAVHHERGGDNGHGGVLSAADLDLAVQGVAPVDNVFFQSADTFRSPRGIRRAGIISQAVVPIMVLYHILRPNSSKAFHRLTRGPPPRR